MMCQRCGKNQATVHSVQSVNGVKSESYLCSDCARELGIMGGMGSMMEGMSFGNDLLKSFFGFGGSQPSLGRACSRCGTSLLDFEKTGLMGCPDCYSEFHDDVIPVLKRVQGNVQHVGDIPEEAKDEKAVELEALKKEMDAAIKAEEFEKAAELRDKINQLKEEGDHGHMAEGE